MGFSSKLVLLLAGLLVCPSLPALARGGGGGGAAGTGAATALGSPGSYGGGSPIPTQSGTTNTQNVRGTSTSTEKSPPAQLGISTQPAAATLATQPAAAALVKGIGTAPNGAPIGTPGSGPGSPEQPYDSGAASAIGSSK